MAKPLRLPVRRVVELVLRCGDIDSRYADSSAMLEGARAHRKIQKSMGPGYQKEVHLKLETLADGIPVLLTGRADGVFEDQDGMLTVDEIKTTTLPFAVAFTQMDTHLGQAKCYAHMLLQTSDREEAAVQLTYCQLETNEIERRLFKFTRTELQEFFDGLMSGYGVWLRFERGWKELCLNSARAAAFPFPAYRKGQRELAVAAYRAIERRQKLYVQAPTGIGKTISTIFPAVKAIGEEKAETLFYLTAKTVTRAVAENAVALMAGQGLRFKSVTLRAKDKICPLEERICNPDFCPRAKGHYSRVNGALLALISENDLITPDITADYAQTHMVCPHELSLDAAMWADLVICDYNHVFDPAVYLRRFFADETGDYVFLIDEAHNLADRVRDMYTAALEKSAFLKLKSKVTDRNPAAMRLKKAAGKLNQYLIGVRKGLAGRKSLSKAEQDEDFAALVFQFSAAAEEWLAQEKNGAHPLQKDVLELYFASLAYLGAAERFDERYAAITEINANDVIMTLFCLDPSDIIEKALSRAKASVLFSATLTPLDYYRDMLGGAQDGRVLALQSPFDQNRLLLAAHHGISTKYQDREESCPEVAEAIYEAVSRKQGNYIAYFPSYEYMRRVHEVFAGQYPVATVIQQSAMDEDERERFLRRFDAENHETLVGFCVMGGIFSEGIDLAGERLIGAVVVGVGLPKLSLRQDLIRDYFDEKNGSGYEYAYVYPGMNKVLQAVGRVIRAETDYGAAVLIDSRFSTARYRALYPAHWSGINMVKTTGELRALMEGFAFFEQE